MQLFLLARNLRLFRRMSTSNNLHAAAAGSNSTCYTNYDKDRLKIIDIGANLSDDMYSGKYNHSDRSIHPNDIDQILERSFANHVEKIIITGTNLPDSKHVLELAKKSNNLYITVGCHPTRCDEFDKAASPEQYFNDLLELIQSNDQKVVAVGECGLDYDRLRFCKEPVQKKYFEKQLELAKITRKPLFLHCRNSYADFFEILKRHHDQLSGGVVHSFTGSKEEAKLFTDMGYYIGINGCSLKTEENIEAMCSIPTEFLMIETDCPWCEVRASHAGQKYIKTKFPSAKKENWNNDIFVKGRNEPAAIVQVLEIMAGARGEDLYSLAQAMYQNTNKLFKF